MKFIHTADWHLGRLFHSIHLTDDQRFALQGLLQVAEERDVDAVVVAGDIFDRAVPPTEAVDLLDDTLGTLALDLQIPVVMIAGNHDSPARLEYLSGLARRANVHVVGRVGAEPRRAEVVGTDGTSVLFWPLAYTDPATARFELGRDDIHSHEAAIRAQLEVIEAGPPRGAREILVAHAFISGSRESESERPLTVGGQGAVDRSLLDAFDYVALGHLHEPQAVSGSMRYAGSLLKYSFNEAGHRKSVALVEVGKEGPAAVEEISLPVRRDVRQLKGKLDEILDQQIEPALAEAYVEVILTDDDPMLNPVDKLRPVFPHVLSIRREQAAVDLSGPHESSAGMKTRGIDELFAEFFEDVKGTPLDEPQTEELAVAMREIERKRREVGDT